MSRRTLATGLVASGSQAAYALTNFLAVAAVARTVSTEAFGVFSLIYAAFTAGGAASRTVNGMPLGIEAVNGDGGQDVDRGALGGALWGGTVLALILVAVARLTPSSIEAAVVVLALAAPVVLAQDALRHVAFARHRAGEALGADLIWLVIQAGGLVVLEIAGPSDPTSAMIVWAGAAAASSLWLAVRLRTRPDVAAAPGWLRRSWRFGSGFTLENLLAIGPRQIAQWIVGALAGFHIVGVIRAATLLLAPVQTVMTGLVSALVPACRSAYEHAGLRSLRRVTSTIAVGLAAATVVVVGALSLAPDAFGEAVVGDTWKEARSIVWLLGIEQAAAATMLAATIGLRVLSIPWAGVRARAITALMIVIAGPIGGVMDGPRGFAVALAGVAIVGAVLWRRRWREELDAVLDGSSQEEPPTCSTAESSIPPSSVATDG